MVVTFFYIVSEVKPGIVRCPEHYYRSLSRLQLSLHIFWKQTFINFSVFLTESSVATYCTHYARPSKQNSYLKGGRLKTGVSVAGKGEGSGALA